MKRVATEREQMRAKEMARLRNQEATKTQGRNIRGAESKTYMKSVVERFSLQKAFMDDNTTDRLAQAGLRGQAALTRFLFVRFISPIALFIIAAFYLIVVIPGDRPPFMSVIYALGIGLLGAYLPLLLLKNRIDKRQASIR